MARHELVTRWGRDLHPEAVLPEHPRPQLFRDSWLSLNGWWDVAFTDAASPAPTSYDARILVPFSPEAPLSQVGRQLQRHERLSYRRLVEVPAGLVPPGGRLLLHFGAVDQTCEVVIDGVTVGRNQGGYLPFTCDVTDALAGGRGDLEVHVRDLSDGHQHASGKQRLSRGGIWYTASSGIWQTVWLEGVPAVHVERLDLVPHLADSEVEVTVRAPRAAQRGTAVLRIGGVETPVSVGRPTRVAVPDPRPWSPADPHLHDVEVVLGEDRVTSAFGLRSFGVGPDARGFPRLLLNGAAHVPVGVLDQGYWPDGLLTAPSDGAMVHDITAMKALGFDLLRKHVKVEPLRWYHHCDRLGMLVWQDFVNGGGRYRTAAVTWPGRLPTPWATRLRDTRRRSLFGRADETGRELFREESRRTVEHLRGVTSVAAWVPFNEAWGQFDAAAVAEDVRRLDPTRVVDHASGWHDQGAGDLRSLHVYGRPFRVPRRRRGDPRPVVLSEYGGHSLRVAGHVADDEHVHGYGAEHSRRGLAESFASLHAHLATQVPRGLAGTVYTQLSDVEDELNGLVTYDREVLKVDPARTRAALDLLRRE